MRAKEKQARAVQRSIKKGIRIFLMICLGLIALGWAILHYVEVAGFIDRLIIIPVDTPEIDTFYDMLSDHEKPGNKLVFDSDFQETEDLKTVMNKLRDAMGLGHYSIDLETHHEEKPPGFINIQSNNMLGNKMTIYLSDRLKSRREQITVLVHELGHIYVWALPKDLFSVFNQEKLVDTSGIFLGMGVLTLNGMTDEFNMTPEGEYQTSQKTFGYLTPQQFGYLLARYAADHKISDKDLKSHLNSAGWKYYKIGRAYFRKKTEGVYIPEVVVEAQTAIRKFLSILRNYVYNGCMKLHELLQKYRSKESGAAGKSGIIK